MTAHPALIPGRNFVRSVIVKALRQDANYEAALAFASSRWGGSQSETIAKAAVPAMPAGDAIDSQARDFLGLVREASLPGKLTGLRRTPFGVRLLKLTAGARGYFVGSGKAIPLSRPVVEGATLLPLKVGAIIVTTKENFQTSANPDALENLLQTDLLAANSAALDQAFIDPSNAGTADVTPASITYGATTIVASGDLPHDIEALIRAFAGDLSTAYFVADPGTATRIGLTTGSDGSSLYPDAGPRGGSIAGIPLVTSREVPSSSEGGLLVLVDPTGISFNLTELVVELSDQATLEMSDAPAGSSTAVVAASSVSPVSLFTTNSVALKSVFFANWSVDRTGAVAVLTGL